MVRDLAEAGCGARPVTTENRTTAGPSRTRTSGRARRTRTSRTPHSALPRRSRRRRPAQFAALAAVPLAHQAPRPIRAAEVPGAMDELVHDAGGLVLGAHELVAARAADGFVPADGLAG